MTFVYVCSRSSFSIRHDPFRFIPTPPIARRLYTRIFVSAHVCSGEQARFLPFVIKSWPEVCSGSRLLVLRAGCSSPGEYICLHSDGSFLCRFLARCICFLDYFGPFFFLSLRLSPTSWLFPSVDINQKCVLLFVSCRAHNFLLLLLLLLCPKPNGARTKYTIMFII